VEQCQQAGLVWGKELYFDGTKVAANAGKDSLKPRFYVEAHLASLFEREAEEPAKVPEQKSSQGAASQELREQQEMEALVQLPTSLSLGEQEHLAQQNAQRHDWIEALGAQDRQVTGRT